MARTKTGIKTDTRERWRDAMKLVAEDRKRFSLSRDDLCNLIQSGYPVEHSYFHNILKGILPNDWPRLLRALAKVFAEQVPERQRAGREDEYYSRYYAPMENIVSAKQHSGNVAKVEASETPPAPALGAIEKAFRGAEAARSTAGLFEYLQIESEHRKPMYLNDAHRMMTKDLNSGIKIPIPASLLTDASKITLNSLGRDLSDAKAEEDQYVRMLYTFARERRKDVESVLWNDPVYTMQEISVSADNKECTITGGLSDFFSMLANHVSMEFELLSGLKNQGKSKSLSLPKRKRFFRSEASIQRRHAALSITALLVYRSASSGYKVELCKRSEDVAIYRGLFGIIPGGLFQPQVSPLHEWNIHHCIIKEYAEELFRCEFDRRRSNPFYFFYDKDSDPKWKHAADLYRALKQGICKIICSGVVLTMMDWLPQICCVLLIDDPDWYRRQEVEMGNNFENVSRSEFTRSVKRVRTEYDLDNFESEFLEMTESGANGISISGRWVPSSLGSVWLGVKSVREYLSKKRPAMEFTPYLSPPGFDEV